MSNLTIASSPNWVSETNHSPVVKTVAEVLIIVVFISVCARLATRWAVLRAVHVDDCTILVAFLCALGQTIAVVKQSEAGLGKPIADLSPQAIVDFQKSTYAANILYILAIGFTKASVCLYFFALTPIQRHRNLATATGAVCILWTLASVFTVAFQCAPPSVWNFVNPATHCINLVTFWTAYHVLNIITDVLLIYIPFVILLGLQMRTDRKVTILMCFAARITAVIAIIAQLYTLHHDVPGSDDLTQAYWPTTLSTTLVLTLSITTACLPYLKPFLESLESGIIGYGVSSSGSHAASRHGGSASTPGPVKSESKSRNNSASAGLSLKNISSPKIFPVTSFSHRSPSINGPRSPTSPNPRQHNGLEANNTTATTIWSTRGKHKDDADNESQGSQSRIIKKTIGWAVSDDTGATIESSERDVSNEQQAESPPGMRMPIQGNESPDRRSKEDKIGFARRSP